MSRKVEKILAAFDTETDPFERGGEPVVPFVWGFYRVNEGQPDYDYYWGKDCIPKFIAFLETLDEPHLIYAHNGGRFDFLFMLKHIAEEVMVINGRIVKCTIGIHEFRDSYAILPVSLGSTGTKDEIDYKLMRRAVRNGHKPKILSYLKQDCVALWDQVSAYRARFGSKITMASAAIASLKDHIETESAAPAGFTLHRLSEEQDANFRPFFFGGRVECIERGCIQDHLTLVDRNSMYPTEMAEREHPTGNRFLRQTSIDDRTDFAVIDATSEGAFPFRVKGHSLTFPKGERHIFRVTGHEIRTAMELGKCEIHRVLWASFAPMRTSFRTFVDEYYRLRQDANERGDKTAVLHFKLVLNSSYGRFALDPRKLQEWAICANGFAPEPDDTRNGQPYWDIERPWRPAFLGEDVTFWRRDLPRAEAERARMNVATGASITGAARASLFRALCNSERPVYCDTDSVLARVVGVPMDDGAKRLGLWTKEAEGTHAYLAGKKLYALADARLDATKEQREAGKFVTVDGRRVPVLKMASKGVRLTGDEIAAVARGEVVTWEAEAPSITIAGVQTHMKRRVRMR